MIIPRPVEQTEGPGRLALGPGLHLLAGPGTRRAADLLAGYLGGARPHTSDGPPISLLLAGPGERESYELDITTEGASLTAATEAGLLHGVQTLRQLLPVEALEGDCDAWSWPVLHIRDQPRMPWRGVLLDVARHFLPLTFLYEFVDQLALHKLNVLQLHLTDDQGWRMEIEGWPRLTEVGAWRPTRRGGRQGGWYTQLELRGLVAYAQERGVTVVPEIEMPGHVRAALAAYPELGNRPDTVLPVWSGWGISEDILGVHEAALAFCRDVLGQVAEVFPSPYLHLGGDECPTVQWAASADAAERVAALGLAGPEALHGWFLSEMHAFVAGLGRRAMSWDETGHASGELPRGMVLTAWRDPAHARAAIARGHQIVMAPHRSTYLDYPQSNGVDEPAGQPGEAVTLSDVYGFDPLAGGLPVVDDPAGTSPGVLGTQANLWTEYAPTPEHVTYLAYPRLCALAEVAWSPPGGDPEEFAVRLDLHERRLAALGVRSGPADSERLVSGPR